ncbi:MAG: cysteine--tRNA ligase [Planctomycetota bacterium]|jgi:cysteinyl-tRNA synthetase
MALKVYNTLSRTKEEFKPLEEGYVRMYVCGPTVYDHPHIGHAKSYVSFDAIVRYLRYLGYKVKYVQNITDVGHLTDDADEGEDKIEKRAAAERLDPMELVETYTRSYFEDMDALNCLRPDISPRATGHVPEQIEIVKTLIDKGFAYEVNGSVYFDVPKFADYGRLSGKKLEDLTAGARVEVNPEKRNPTDFALWKKATVGHILRWNSPWGWGYPGWHLECSVMSMRYLGDSIDIHGGGLENAFPHHECEIAQSEAATGVPFAKYWLHNNMVTVDGVKMGKSLGNFITLKDAFRKYHPLAIRYFVLTSHYRSPLDFSEEAIEAAAKGLERIHNVVRAVREALSSPGGDGGAPAGDETLLTEIDEFTGRFREAMDEDFNTPQAIAVLSDLVRRSNTLLSQETPGRTVLEKLSDTFNHLGGDVLGIVTDALIGEEGGGGLEADLVTVLIKTRESLRKAKNFEAADRIRARLSEIGVELMDTPEGTTWKRV